MATAGELLSRATKVAVLRSQWLTFAEIQTKSLIVAASHAVYPYSPPSLSTAHILTIRAAQTMLVSIDTKLLKSTELFETVAEKFLAQKMRSAMGGALLPRCKGLRWRV